MSDRYRLFDLDTGREGESVQFVMDGDTGTWRLFIIDDGERANVDFSLAGLREFHAALGKVLSDIESDPITFNAEERCKY